MKRFLSLLLCLCMLAAPALAAEGDVKTSSAEDPSTEAAEPQMQAPAAWAYEWLTEAEALELLDINTMYRLYDTVTEEEVSALASVVASHLERLNLEKTPAVTAELDYDGTRNYALSVLAPLADGYDWGVDTTADTYAALIHLGVVLGDGVSLALERECTVQEYVVFCARLVLNAYDAADAGSKGLFWKATNPENGATLYLLGTIHVDRGNVYPLHKSIRTAMDESSKVYFELDFNDAEGMAYFTAAQMYADGDKLSNNISPELFEQTVAVFAEYGLTEEALEYYKPWALSNTLTSLMGMDDSTGSFMAVDSYLYSRAFIAGKEVGGIETYELQTSVFDTMSEEYQQAMLQDAVDMYYAEDYDYGEALDDMLTPWIDADLEAFCQIYDKDAFTASEDEFVAKLLLERDPAMIQSAADFLAEDGSTSFLAVGSAHMIGDDGIVAGLEALGFTVERINAA